MADQLVLYKQITGANADEGEAGAQRAKEASAMLWGVAEAIAGVPKPKLKEALELNGRMFGDKASPFELRHTIADGLLNGRLPPCPWCKCEALEQEGGLITCRGYLEGATACEFKQTAYGVMGSKATAAAEAVPLERVPWVAHPAVEKSLHKAGGLPAAAPSRRLGGAGGAAAAPSGAAGGSAGAGGAAAAAVDDGAASEDEEGIATAQVMAGMSFACVGSVRPSAKELQRIIEEHGGAWVAGSIGDGSCLTHLLSTAAEGLKPTAKQSAKYATALAAGLPVVSGDFVLALARQLPEADADAAVAPAPAPKRAKGVAAKAEAEAAAAAAEAEEEVPLESLKVAELRERLVARGLGSDGKKAVLLARLQQAVAEQGSASGGGSAANPMLLDDEDEVRVLPSSPDEEPKEEEPKAEEEGGKRKKRALPSSFASGAKAKTEAAAAAAAAVEATQGAKLRQRKHMQACLLDTNPHPNPHPNP